MNLLSTLELLVSGMLVVWVRELTKLYEEYQRGLISQLLTQLEEEPAKGECLLIVAGYDAGEEKLELEELAIKELFDDLVAQGNKPSQAIKQIAKDYQLNRQEVYRSYHQLD